ncbi:hypothetical protein C8Q76DRAFT_619051 [Earliella scabrosa]|nr:hypothetical protein C8Q76DRAFT_619051 [Earliella scabrosa]
MTSKKTILITGCSANGIGAALADALAKAGHTVFATARDPSKIPTTLTALPNVKTLALDVTSPSSVADAVAAVKGDDRAGRLDVLVNNAGAGYTIPLLDADLEQARRVHDTNVWGPLRTTQAFADLLIASKGRVVNISSVGAVVNTPWIGVYSSSKAALNILSDTLRLELAPFGVSVLTVLVGTVSTPFHANEPDVELPPASRYALIRDTISKWAKGEAGPKGGSPDELAASLVDDVVGNGKSGQVWKGANSGAVKFVSRWVPTSMADGMMSGGQGLDELSKSLQKS